MNKMFRLSFIYLQEMLLQIHEESVSSSKRFLCIHIIE